MDMMKQRTIGLLPVIVLTFLGVTPVRGQVGKEVDGVIVTVQNPITMAQWTKIKLEVDGARNTRPNVKKVVFDFNPEGKEAATEEYGPCYELANYIRNLQANGVLPIAFVHGKTTRHTVLPVLACEDLVMSSSAQLGEVWSKTRPVPKAERDYYEELAGIHRSGPVAKMIDKDVKVVQGLYRGAAVYVDLRKVDGPNKEKKFEEVQVVNKTPIAMSAGVELYNTEGATRFLGCKLQKETRAEVRDWYQLSNKSEQGDPLRGQAVKAVKIVLEGPINVSMREKLRRQIETARANGENTFFFVIETSGAGDQAQKAAQQMAEEIIKLGKDPEKPAQTIAYVPGKATDLAIFLAMACQNIVMFKGNDPMSEAVLGDFETMLGGPNNNPQNGRRVNEQFLREALEHIAEQTGNSKLLVQGMFDKNVVILRARNDKTGDRMLMSEAELKAQAGQGWVREAVVKDKGVLLKLNASKAKDLKIAKTVDNKDVNEVYALFGVEPGAVRSSEPSWLDDFAAFLRRTEVSILLVIVGIAGLVLELKAPGLIVPGVIAAICFVLFFWAQTQLGGQLIYLAIMLFLLGLALLGIEIFLLPGFGVAGVSGIMLILCGLVLAGLDKAPESSSEWADLVGKMLRYGLTMAGAGVLAFILSRFLPHIPYANRLMLVPPEDKLDAEEFSALPGVATAVSLLGQVGTTESMLRPSGLAKIGDKYIDVVTEGDFIPPGTPIQVIEVEGTRIVVKRI